MNKFMAQILEVAANSLASKKAEKNPEAIATTVDAKKLVTKQALTSSTELQIDQKQEIGHDYRIELTGWKSITAVCVIWVSTLLCVTATQMASGRLIINLEVEKSKIKFMTDIDKRGRQLTEEDPTQDGPSFGDDKQ